MKKKMIFSLFAGIAISVTALYFAFKNVPFSELIEYFQSIDYFWMSASLLFVGLSFFMRALRWQVILRTASRISFWRAYHPMMIGFMLNCVLPARIGELARPAILQQKEKVPFATGLATVATERLFDLFFLILLFAVVLSVVDIDPDIEMSFGSYTLNRTTLLNIGSGMVKISLILIFGIALISIDRFRKLIRLVIMKIPDIFSFAGARTQEAIGKYLCLPLVSIMENIAAGFSLVKDMKNLALCLFFSLTIWLLQAFSYYIITRGCPGVNISPFEATAVLIIICFFIALPSVPGFWGLWEAGAVFALSLFAIGAKEASGFALVSHAIQMFPVIIAGFISAIIYGVNIRQIKYNS
ncbi:MAG: lysylphosphatidylglycerol synthase transmembrane domain-containing protein [Pseudomonadota bacterium]